MQITLHETEAETIDRNHASGHDNPLDISFQRASFGTESYAVRTVEQLRQFINQNIDNIFERVLALCYQSTERAEEVVQELYPRLLRFLETHPEGLHQPWAAVIRVARHLAIDEHRRSIRRRHKPLPDDDALKGNHFNEDAETQDEQGLHIHEAIRVLPPRLANIVHGLFFDGRTGKALAAELSLSEARLSELKSDALTQLRAVLTDPRPDL